LVGDVVRTTWVLAATVTIPLSMLNGPVVNGVTFGIGGRLLSGNVKYVQCRYYRIV
jgi:hypothetical protein